MPDRFAHNYPVRQPNTLLLYNPLAMMGVELPSAMAAKTVHPERRVLAVCGDGGFMMNSLEMETARRLDLDLVVLILNDASYRMIQWKQADMGFEDFGVQFENPDFLKYADSYGATGHRIERSEDFEPTLENAFESDGVHLINLPVDYSENGAVLLHEIPREFAALDLD